MLLDSVLDPLMHRSSLRTTPLGGPIRTPIQVRVLPDGTRVFEGEPTSLASFFLAYDQAASQEGPSHSKLGFTVSGRRRKKWRSRFRPNRRDTKNPLNVRLIRAIDILQTICAGAEAVNAGHLVEVLKCGSAAGLGSAVKDTDRFLADAGFNPREVWLSRGQSPRHFLGGPKLKDGLASLKARLAELQARGSD
jgi:hypothetical protein